ncbi:MAG: RibD family protein, partial [Candidatus Poribacteria bacterium]
IVPEKDGKVNLTELMRKLAELEITNILIEGGAEVNASALKEKIVDRVIFFIAPKIIGGNLAPGPIGGEGAEDPSKAIKLTDISITQIGEDILVIGTPSYKSDD